MNIRSQRRTRRARRTRRTRRTKRAGRTRKTRRTRRTRRTKKTRTRRTKKTKRAGRTRKTKRSRRVIYQSAGADPGLERATSEYYDTYETSGEIAQAERLKADQVARAREQLAAIKAWEVEQEQRYNESAAKREALQIWIQRARQAEAERRGQVGWGGHTPISLPREPHVERRGGC